MARTTTTRTRRPQMTDEEKKAYNAARRAELEAIVTSAYAVLHTDPVWGAMLAVAAALPTRGPVNVVAITAQMPTATDVRGKTDWRKDGRYPAKGSTSLRVWAPMAGRSRQAAEDAEPQATNAADAEPTGPDRTRAKVRTFKAAPVYDVSQTAGEPLPAAKEPAHDPAALAANLGHSLPEAVCGDAAPTAVRELLTRLALERLAGPETVPGQRAAEAASAAHLAARMLRIPPGPAPAPAPALGGIVTGAQFTPAIKDAAERVIATGRALADLATGRQAADRDD
ncbi:hypothetical protein [Streptomyces chryseus]|uniref:hypothetical protein n=1 Tax=Streptomyces chryseus TaxID=68186 RepID=UPI00167209D0|nr:hypothetical protein [Streptomyces chryseus]GGX36387.1 hypothetical protein GCM10010353_59290 [Streptomyces chryseus]